MKTALPPQPAFGLRLPGSIADLAEKRMCSRHKEMAPSGGGVQATPKNWVCGKCWRKGVLGQKTAARNVARAQQP